MLLVPVSLGFSVCPREILTMLSQSFTTLAWSPLFPSILPSPAQHWAQSSQNAHTSVLCYSLTLLLRATFLAWLFPFACVVLNYPVALSPDGPSALDSWSSFSVPLNIVLFWLLSHFKLPLFQSISPASTAISMQMMFNGTHTLHILSWSSCLFLLLHPPARSEPWFLPSMVLLIVVWNLTDQERFLIFPSKRLCIDLVCILKNFLSMSLSSCAFLFSENGILFPLVIWLWAFSHC